MGRWLRPGEQPKLQEMLDDPVVRVVMHRDGVDREQVEMLVRTLAAEGDWRAAAPVVAPAATAEDNKDLLAASLCVARRQVVEADASGPAE